MVPLSMGKTTSTYSHCTGTSANDCAGLGYELAGMYRKNACPYGTLASRFFSGNKALRKDKYVKSRCGLITRKAHCMSRPRDVTFSTEMLETGAQLECRARMSLRPPHDFLVPPKP